MTTKELTEWVHKKATVYENYSFLAPIRISNVYRGNYRFACIDIENGGRFFTSVEHAGEAFLYNQCRNRAILLLLCLYRQNMLPLEVILMVVSHLCKMRDGMKIPYDVYTWNRNKIK
jgi:hypothetical protein